MSQPIRLLHFADAHIDMINFGRHDPATGLPQRIIDFLQALDQIVEAAIGQRVDLVIFAGDAYRNRRPDPRFQREWQQRIMRLSEAGIPTILLVGNHDTGPNARQGNALQEFRTLRVPHVIVGDRLALLGPAQLGVPVQVITVPWISHNMLLTRDGARDDEQIGQALEEQVDAALRRLVAAADPDLPLIITAHTTVAGAQYGSERQVTFGREVTLPLAALQHAQVDYVALGHIHKHQALGHSQPPVVYAGSIERVDFGEAGEGKGYVLAEVARGTTTWRFEPLKTRRFLEYSAAPDDPERFMAQIVAQLPDPAQVTDAIVRLRLRYARAHEPLLDEAEIGRHFAAAFDFRLIKERSDENRSRLGAVGGLETMSPEDLLQLYWQTRDVDSEEAGRLQNMFKELVGDLL